MKTCSMLLVALAGSLFYFSSPSFFSSSVFVLSTGYANLYNSRQ
jgi:hypothetical protein